MAILKESGPTILPLQEKWPYDLVECIWDDAESFTGWEIGSQINPKDSLCTTIGFLLKKTKKHLVIASTVSWDDGVEEHTSNNRIQIPVGMVKRLTILVNKHVDKPKSKATKSTQVSDDLV
jgi:hypothetical protein